MSNFEKAKASHKEKMHEQYKHRDKTADEMFEELGYTKTEDRFTVRYHYEKDFDKRMISIHLSPRLISNTWNISIDEHHAIHQKCIELGWID